MQGAHFAGLLTFVLLLLFGFIFFFHACFHYGDFWSLFMLIPVTLAFLSPAVCFGYNRQEDVYLNSGSMGAQEFRNCRELGWSFALILLLGSYGIPVLAWYNANLWWAGVVEVYVGLTCWIWAYIIWLKIFVFY